MIYTHRTVLKSLLNEYFKTKEKSLYVPDLFELYKTNKYAFRAIEYLLAKNLIKCKFDIQRNIYEITLTNKGLTHQDDVLSDLIQFLTPTLISIAALIVSILK